MKLVKFEDGTFGIRKFSLFHLGWAYKDFRDDYWWSQTSKYFQTDCRTDEATARKILDKGMVVK